MAQNDANESETGPRESPAIPADQSGPSAAPTEPSPPHSSERPQSEELLKRVTEIRDALAPKPWWRRPVAKRCAILFFGIVLLCIVDFRTTSDVKVADGTTIKLVTLPEPKWEETFPDKAELTQLRPGLTKFWGLPDLPEHTRILPVFVISLERAGISYREVWLRLIAEGGKTVARFDATESLTLNGPSTLRVRALDPDAINLNSPVLRTCGIEMASGVVPLSRFVDLTTGKGSIKITTRPPVGLARVKYNLEKAWGLFF